MFSELCLICHKPKSRELPCDPICTCPQVGDVLENTSEHALARKIRITEVSMSYFMADVLEGENTTEPLKVFRAGWFLYQKPCEHEWESKPMGGSPADAESSERVTVCKKCGMEPSEQE